MSVEINHIEDLLSHIEGREEFVIGDKDGYTFVDYLHVMPDSFDNPMRLECRGIKFDADGFIMARPFAKFFNVGEKQSPDEVGELLRTRNHVVLPKLDGSMIHPAILDNQLVFMTRKGITDVSQAAFNIFGNDVDYFRFSWHCLVNLGITPIFEYTGPTNRIVLRYDRARLTLIGARHTITGEDYYLDAKLIAVQYGVDVLDPFTFKKYSEKGELIGLEEIDTVTDIHEFTTIIKALKDEEGVVIKFSDGLMFKMKAEDYVLKHRALGDFGSKKKVLALVLQGFVDDVLPALDEADANELREFDVDVWGFISEICEKIKTKVEKGNAVNYSRKDFATCIVPWFEPKGFGGLIYTALDGKDVMTQAVKFCMKNPKLVPVKWRGE